MISQSVKKSKLASNYEKHKLEIWALKKYCDSLIRLKDSLVVEEITLEFENSKKLKKVSISYYDTARSAERIIYEKFGIYISDSELKNMLAKFSWQMADLRGIYQRLKKINCISVSIGKPFYIGYKRTFMAKYSYVLFDRLVNKSDKLYNDSCNYYLYSENIGFNYSTGVVGPECFPEDFW